MKENDIAFMLTLLDSVYKPLGFKVDPLIEDYMKKNHCEIAEAVTKLFLSFTIQATQKTWLR